MKEIKRQAQKLLTQRRAALLRSWNRISDEEAQLSAAEEKDWSEIAADREAEAVLSALSEREHRELEEIEAALARLGNSTYGLCLGCGRAIGRQRLLAIPEASLCLECSAIR